MKGRISEAQKRVSCELATREPTEEELIQGVLAADEKSFNVLYDRYYRRIYHFALKRLHDAAEAEDVTQEVFVQVFRCLPSFEGRSSLLGWMFGITHFQVCRRYRRNSPTTVSLDAAEAISLASPAVGPERRIEAARVLERVDDALESELSPSQRRIFDLRYGENYSMRGIATRVGKSKQAVKISLFRTRRTLARSARGLDGVLTV